jgi:expansin (peptidoglycan-binding protein)
MYRYLTAPTTIPQPTLVAGQFTSVKTEVTTYGASGIKSGSYLFDNIQNEVRQIVALTPKGFTLDSAFTLDVSVAQDIYIVTMTTVNTTIYNNGDDVSTVDGQDLPAYAPTILNLELTYPIIVNPKASVLLVTEKSA